MDVGAQVIFWQISILLKKKNQQQQYLDWSKTKLSSEPHSEKFVFSLYSDKQVHILKLWKVQRTLADGF